MMKRGAQGRSGKLVVGLVVLVLVFCSLLSYGTATSSTETAENETIEQSITILNPQSYPTLGGNWTIYFNTTGSGTLEINDHSFPEEVDFVGFYRKDGDVWREVPATIIGDRIFADWSFNQTFSKSLEGKAVFKVLHAGTHLLEFRFGNVAYAKNQVNFYATTSGGTGTSPANVQGTPDNAYALVSGKVIEQYVYGSGFSTDVGEITQVEIAVEYNWLYNKEAFTLEYKISGVLGATSVALPGDAATDTQYFLDVTADRSWTWTDISNLEVHVRTATANPAQGVDCNVDACFVRITSAPPNNPPEEIGYDYSYKQDGGWGETWEFDCKVNDTDGDPINVTLQIYDGEGWVDYNTNITDAPSGNWANFTSVDYNEGVGGDMWGSDDVGETLTYRFLLYDGTDYNTTANHTTIALAKDDTTLSYSQGDGGVVNRAGTETITLEARLYDTDRNAYPEGEIITFEIDANATAVNDTQDDTTNATGYATLALDPGDTYDVGIRTWNATFAEASAYKASSTSSYYSFTVYGTITNTNFTPSALTDVKLGDSIDFSITPASDRASENNATTGGLTGCTVQINISDGGGAQQVINGAMSDGDGDGNYTFSNTTAGWSQGLVDVTSINSSKNYYNSNETSYPDVYRVGTTQINILDPTNAAPLDSSNKTADIQMTVDAYFATTDPNELDTEVTYSDFQVYWCNASGDYKGTVLDTSQWASGNWTLNVTPPALAWGGYNLKCNLTYVGSLGDETETNAISYHSLTVDQTVPTTASPAQISDPVAEDMQVNVTVQYDDAAKTDLVEANFTTEIYDGEWVTAPIVSGTFQNLGDGNYGYQVNISDSISTGTYDVRTNVTGGTPSRTGNDTETGALEYHNLTVDQTVPITASPTSIDDPTVDDLQINVTVTYDGTGLTGLVVANFTTEIYNDTTWLDAAINSSTFVDLGSGNYGYMADVPDTITTGYHDVRTTVTGGTPSRTGNDTEADSLRYVVNEPPTEVAYAYQLEQNAGWGETFRFDCQVNDTEGDNVTVRLEISNNSEWREYQSNITVTNLPGWANFTDVDYNEGLGGVYLWTSADVDVQLQYRFVLNDTYSSPTPGTAHVVAENLTKDDTTLTYISGDGLTVNRSGAETVTLVVRLNDTDRDAYPEGETITFEIDANATADNDTKTAATNATGYATLLLDPDDTYDVGVRTWNASIINNAAYKTSSTGYYSFTVNGTINNTNFGEAGTYSIGPNPININITIDSDDEGEESTYGLVGCNVTLYVYDDGGTLRVDGATMADENNGNYTHAISDTAGWASGYLRIRINSSKPYYNGDDGWYNTSILLAIYDVIITDPADQTTPVNMNATYEIAIKNNGTMEDTFDLAVENTNNAAIAALNQSTITLAAEATGNVTLNVTDETAGIYSVNVTATSQGDSTKTDKITVITTVEFYDVIITDPADQTTALGVNATYEIAIKNNGTVEDTFDLTFENLDAADVVALNQSTIILAAGVTGNVTLNVTDNDATGVYNVSVNATSQTDSSATDTVTIATNVTSPKLTLGNVSDVSGDWGRDIDLRHNVTVSDVDATNPVYMNYSVSWINNESWPGGIGKDVTEWNNQTINMLSPNETLVTVNVNSSNAENASAQFWVNITKRDLVAEMLSPATQGKSTGVTFWINTSCVDEHDVDFTGDADLTENGVVIDTQTDITRYANFSLSKDIEGTYNYTVTFYNTTYYVNDTTGYSNVTITAPVLAIGNVSDVSGDWGRDLDLRHNVTVSDVNASNPVYMNYSVDWIANASWPSISIVETKWNNQTINIPSPDEMLVTVNVNSSNAENASAQFWVNITKRDTVPSIENTSTISSMPPVTFWINGTVPDEYGDNYIGNASLLRDGTEIMNQSAVGGVVNFSVTQSDVATYEYALITDKNATYYNANVTTENRTVTTYQPTLALGNTVDMESDWGRNFWVNHSVSVSNGDMTNPVSINYSVSWLDNKTWDSIADGATVWHNRSESRPDPEQNDVIINVVGDGATNDTDNHIWINVTKRTPTSNMDSSSTQVVAASETFYINATVIDEWGDDYVGSADLLRELVVVSTQSVTNNAVNFTYSETSGTYNFSVRFYNTTHHLNTTTTNSTVTVDTAPPEWYDQGQDVDSLHKGESITVSTRWTDNTDLKNATLSANATDGWENIETIYMGGTDKWSNFTLSTQLLNWTPGIKGWNITANDTVGNENTTDIMTFELWGYSNVSWTSPDDGTYSPGDIVELKCQVRDTNSSAVVGNYPVKFWWYNSTMTQYLGENTTDVDGYTTLSWDTSGLAQGAYCPKANITDNATLFYNISTDWECNTSVNLALDAVPPEWYDQGQNVSFLHKGESIEVYARWTDNLELGSAILSANATDGWENIETIYLGGTDKWSNFTLSTQLLNWTPGIKGWNITGKDAVGNPNTTDIMTFELWGYSNVSWTSPTGGSTYSPGEIVQLVCLVRDANSSSAIVNYPVKFYNVSGEVATYLGQNTTNASGYAVWYWDTSGLSEGAYYPKANITDNATLFYNISADWECNTSVTLSDTTPPEWYDRGQNVDSLHKGEKINVSARWTDNLELKNATLSHNGSGVWVNVSPIALSGIEDWSNFTVTAALDWTPGVKGWKIYANDTSDYENVTDVMPFKVWGYSNVSWTSPPDGSTRTVGDTIELVAHVRDANSSLAIDGHPVKFYNVSESDGVTTYLGQNTTNASGYAVWYWDTTGLSTGIYYPKANITDNATLFYNISADWECNTSLTLAVYDVIITDPPDQTTALGVNATYEIAIKNNGTAGDTFDLSLVNTSNADVAALNKTTITIGAGATGYVTLNVTDNNATGIYNVNVTATSQNDPSATDTVTIATNVTRPKLTLGNVSDVSADWGRNFNLNHSVTVSDVDATHTIYTNYSVSWINNESWPGGIGKDVTEWNNQTINRPLPNETLVTVNVNSSNAVNASASFWVNITRRDLVAEMLSDPTQGKSTGVTFWINTSCVDEHDVDFTGDADLTENGVVIDTQTDITRYANFSLSKSVEGPYNYTVEFYNTTYYVNGTTGYSNVTITAPVLAIGNVSDVSADWGRDFELRHNVTVSDVDATNPVYMNYSVDWIANASWPSISIDETKWNNQTINISIPGNNPVTVNVNSSNAVNASTSFWINITKRDTVPSLENKSPISSMPSVTFWINGTVPDEYGDNYIGNVSLLENGTEIMNQSAVGGVVNFSVTQSDVATYEYALITDKNTTYYNANVTTENRTVTTYQPTLALGNAMNLESDWGRNFWVNHSVSLSGGDMTNPVNLNYSVSWLDNKTWDSIDDGATVWHNQSESRPDPDPNDVIVNVTGDGATNDTDNPIWINITKRNATATMDSSPTQIVKTSETFYINATVADEHDDNYVGSADLLRELEVVNTSSVTNNVVNFTHNETSGTYNFSVRFYNTTHYFNKTTTNSTVTVDTASPEWHDQGQNVPSLHKGESIEVYARWTDNIELKNATLSANATVGWEDIETIYLGDNDTWSNFTLSTQLLSWTPGIKGWNITANDTVGNENTTNIMTFKLWGYSNVSWTSPDDGTYSPGDIVELKCLVRDANSSATVENYPVRFYNVSGEVATYLGENITNADGYAVCYWNTSGLAEGIYCPKANITDNATLFYNISADWECNTSVNLALDAIAPEWHDQGQNVPSLHKGESIEVYARWTDNIELKNATLSANATVGWEDIETIYLGDNDTWSNFTLSTQLLSWTPGIKGWNITANDTVGNENTTYIMTFELWGYSNVSWTSPDDGTYSPGTIMELKCLVRDANSSAAIGNYPVKFWWHNSTMTQYLGENTTDANGYTTLSWDTSGLDEGIYYPKANITDNATLFYNISADWECNTSVTLSDTTPPEWYGQSQDVDSLHKGESINVYARWTDNLELKDATLSHNGSGSWVNVSTVALSGTEDWSNFTVTAALDWTPGVKGWKIYANDTSDCENVTDVMAFKVWGYSNVSWTSPSDDITCTVGDTIELVAYVIDANSSSNVQNYPVKFYNVSGEVTTYLGQNTTNASGYAVWYWDTTGLSTGIYYPKANVTDNASLYYNASADCECNTSLTLAVYEVIITDPADQTTHVNVNATYEIAIKNNGTVEDTFDLAVENTDNAAVAALNQSTMTLAAEATGYVTLNVTDETVGTYSVNVTATSQGDDTKTDKITVITRVEFYDVIITAPPNQSTTVNVNATYEIPIKNNGTAEDTFDLTIENIDNATVAALNQSTITLAAGVSGNVTLNVTDESGGVYNVSVTATSQGYSDATDTVTITTTIPVEINVTVEYTPIKFGNVSHNITNYQADSGVSPHDYDGNTTPNGFPMNITIEPDTNVNVDIFFKGDDFANNTYNFSVSNLTMDDDDSLTDSPEIGINPFTFSTTYPETGVFTNISSGTTKSCYFWLSTPLGQYPGSYGNNVSIMVNETVGG